MYCGFVTCRSKTYDKNTIQDRSSKGNCTVIRFLHCVEYCKILIQIITQ